MCMCTRMFTLWLPPHRRHRCRRPSVTSRKVGGRSAAAHLHKKDCWRWRGGRGQATVRFPNMMKSTAYMDLHGDQRFQGEIADTGQRRQAHFPAIITRHSSHNKTATTCCDYVLRCLLQSAHSIANDSRRTPCGWAAPRLTNRAQDTRNPHQECASTSCRTGPAKSAPAPRPQGRQTDKCPAGRTRPAFPAGRPCSGRVTRPSAGRSRPAPGR